MTQSETMFLPQETIRKKRDGLPVPREEISQFIRGVVEGTVGEGQIAAFAMATLLKGMSIEECVSLTLAMRDSGEVLDWNPRPPCWLQPAGRSGSQKVKENCKL